MTEKRARIPLTDVRTPACEHRYPPSSPNQSRSLFKTADNVVFDVSDASIFPSTFMKKCVHTARTYPLRASEPFPMPNVNADVLDTVLKYCYFHTSQQRKTMTDSEIRNWDESFMELDPRQLCELASAAYYLDVKDLIDLTCRAIAAIISGKTAEQIRKTFHIENDLEHAFDRMMPQKISRRRARDLPSAPHRTERRHRDTHREPAQPQPQNNDVEIEPTPQKSVEELSEWINSTSTKKKKKKKKHRDKRVRSEKDEPITIAPDAHLRPVSDTDQPLSRSPTLHSPCLSDGEAVVTVTPTLRSPPLPSGEYLVTATPTIPAQACSSNKPSTPSSSTHSFGFRDDDHSVNQDAISPAFPPFEVVNNFINEPASLEFAEEKQRQTNDITEQNNRSKYPRMAGDGNGHGRNVEMPSPPHSPNQPSTSEDEVVIVAEKIVSSNIPKSPQRQRRRRQSEPARPQRSDGRRHIHIRSVPQSPQQRMGHVRRSQSPVQAKQSERRHSAPATPPHSIRNKEEDVITTRRNSRSNPQSPRTVERNNDAGHVDKEESASRFLLRSSREASENLSGYAEDEVEDYLPLPPDMDREVEAFQARLAIGGNQTNRGSKERGTQSNSDGITIRDDTRQSNAEDSYRARSETTSSPSRNWKRKDNETDGTSRSRRRESPVRSQKGMLEMEKRRLSKLVKRRKAEESDLKEIDEQLRKLQSKVYATEIQRRQKYESLTDLKDRIRQIRGKWNLSDSE